MVRALLVQVVSHATMSQACSRCSKHHVALADCNAPQRKSNALAAAAVLSLSTVPHCRHVIMSDSQSDFEEDRSCKFGSMEDRSCKFGSMEDSEIERDQHSDGDTC